LYLYIRANILSLYSIHCLLKIWTFVLVITFAISSNYSHYVHNVRMMTTYILRTVQLNCCYTELCLSPNFPTYTANTYIT